MTERRRRKVGCTTVLVSVRMLRDAAGRRRVAQGLGPDQQAAADGVRRLLRKAEDAAYGDRPEARTGVATGGAAPSSRPRTRTCTPPRAQMVDVTPTRRIAAEIPAALARSQQALHRDDPRRRSVEALGMAGRSAGSGPSCGAPSQDCYDAMDRQHERLRSFRNIILLLALCIAVLVGDHHRRRLGATRSYHAAVLPRQRDGDRRHRCSTARPGRTWPRQPRQRHPRRRRCSGCSAARWPRRCRIRNLRGTSTPYDVPVALALLKVPLGAFTAILGLVAIQGELRPGPVGAGLAAADPRVRAGARLRPAGVHLLAGPQGAVAARRAARQGRVPRCRRRRRPPIAAAPDQAQPAPPEPSGPVAVRAHQRQRAAGGAGRRRRR